MELDETSLESASSLQTMNISKNVMAIQNDQQADRLTDHLNKTRKKLGCPLTSLIVFLVSLIEFAGALYIHSVREFHLEI